MNKKINTILLTLTILLIISTPFVFAGGWTNESGTMYSSWKVGGPSGHYCILNGGTLTNGKTCTSNGTYVNCDTTAATFGTLTNGDLCTTNGTTVACTTATSTFAPAFGTLTSGDFCTTNGTTVACTTATSTFAPAFGTLTSGDFCTTNGTTVACTTGVTGSGGTLVENTAPTFNASGYGLPAASGSTESAGLIARFKDSTSAILDVGGASATGLWLQVADVTNLAQSYPLFLQPTGGPVCIGCNGAHGEVEIAGPMSGYPATSGINQHNIIRIRATITNVLDIGQGNGSDYAFWLQVSDSANLAQHYPLLLNPVGGNIGIGIQNPTHLTDWESSGGGYYSASDHSFHNGSSIRWKTNVQDMANGLATMNCLRPRTYDFDQAHGGQSSIGFIAEEAASCIPTLVDPDPNAPGYYYGINYGNITAVIVAAVREQNAQYGSLLDSFGGALSNYNSVFLMPDSVPSDNSTPRTGVINGGLQLNPGSQTKPDCTDGTRAEHWFTRDANNLNDVEEVCAYVSGVIGWRKITWQ